MSPRTALALVARVAAACRFALLLLPIVAHGGQERLVHRYLETAPSPDGLYVAAVEGDAPPSGREPVVRELVIRRADGSGSVSVELPCGHVRECWPASLAWTPDGHRLSFALRSPGSYARSLYSVAPDGTQVELLLAFDGLIHSLHFADDGTLAMLATDDPRKESGATQAGDPIASNTGQNHPLQRIAVLDHQRLDWISPPGLYVYEYDWLPGRQGFVGTAAAGDGDSHWWSARLYAFDRSSHSAQLLYAPQDPRQQLAEPHVSPDGRAVAFIGGLMSDFGSTGGDVFAVPVAGGRAINLTRGRLATATSIGFDCHGALLVKSLRGDQTQIEQMELGSPDATLRTPAVARILWSGSASVYGGHAGVSFGCPSELTSAVLEDFNDPPEIHSGPLAAWHVLTDLNAGMSVHANTQSVHWHRDGFQQQGWLLTPTGGPRKLPMITVVHGGPASASVAAFVGPGQTRALLDQGYALFFPNPRGSFGQGEAFTLANVRDFGHGDLRDILAGIAAAEHAADIDSTRLGIMGGSYGGYMVMWAVTQTQLFKAAVAQAGISNWISYYGENGIDQWLLPYFGASVYRDRSNYERSNPIRYIQNTRTPTFEYVGELDIECPASQTLEFWHALRELGVPTSMVVYPQEGHGLRDPAHLEDAQQRVLSWFNQYLPPQAPQ